MKRIVFVLFGVLLGCAAYAAETVSSVSFNPSRMGEYTYLKVSDKATLSGGLSATTVNISSGGTVTMNADTSSRIYEVPTVTGASGSAINMPSTVFHGNTADTYASYKSEDAGVPSGLLPNVSVKGGTMTFNNDSYIHTLDAVNILKQKVGSLKGGTLEITGNNGNKVDLYESGDTAGFHLAGNDIPEPVGKYTNTNNNLTGCRLVWEKRKTSTSPAQEVYLLALQGCNGALTPGGDLEPSEPTYKWVLTNQGLNNNAGSNLCYSSCAMSSPISFSSGLPSELAAGVFVPNCSSGNAGSTCNPGGPYTIGGNKYCPTYTCRAVY